MPLTLIPLLITAADVLLSALMIGGAVIAESGDWGAGALAAGGSILNHLRTPGKLKFRKPMEGSMKTTKLLLLLAPAFLIVSMGCSSLFSAKSQIESVIAVQAAGVYVVTLTKNGQTVYTETWECTIGADNKLSGCHKR